jgi:hypothetical protein
MYVPMAAAFLPSIRNDCCLLFGDDDFLLHPFPVQLPFLLKLSFSIIFLLKWISGKGRKSFQS